MARRLGPLLVTMVLLLSTTPAQGQTPAMAGGFACHFISGTWPGNSMASCGAGPRPGQGEAWGTWTNGTAVYVCDPTCTARADFWHDPGICPIPALPPMVTTGTGQLVLDGFYVIEFDWVVVGTTLLITPAGEDSATGIGVFLPAAPLMTCLASGQQAADVVAIMA